jgi:hypothetical protein
MPVHADIQQWRTFWKNAEIPPGEISVRKHVDPAAKLSFEVSDGTWPVALYCASSPQLVGDRFEVALAARSSSCNRVIVG